MRESVGGVSLFGLVIALVLLFAGYISLSINYSKAYNVKNEIVNIIKNQGGVCTDRSVGICYNFAEQISDYFGDVSYHSQGNCATLPRSDDPDDKWYGFKRNGELIGADANNAAFCVRAIRLNGNSELPNALYYQVRLFYQLDLPIIKSVFNLSVSGETSRIYAPNECEYQAANYSWCKDG